MTLHKSPSHSVAPHFCFTENKAMEVKSINCLNSCKHIYSHIYPCNSILPTSSPLSMLIYSFNYTSLSWILNLCFSTGSFCSGYNSMLKFPPILLISGFQSVVLEPLQEVCEALWGGPWGCSFYHPCKARFFSFTSTKTRYCNRLDAQADMRMQLFFTMSDIKEMCKDEKLCHSFH